MLGLPPKNQPPLGPPRLSQREKTLAAWHGYDIAAVEKERPTTRSAAELIPVVLSQLRLDARRIETDVVRAWEALVDPNITLHAKPTGLKNGTLYVTVDSSVWLSEIARYRAKEILNQLQSCFGPELIKRISFRLG